MPAAADYLSFGRASDTTLLISSSNVVPSDMTVDDAFVRLITLNTIYQAKADGRNRVVAASR